MAQGTTFQKDKTGAMQTAANVAGEVVAARLRALGQVGDSEIPTIAQINKDLEKVTNQVFKPLAEKVDEDNELFRKQAEEDRKHQPKSSGGGRKGGGGGKGTGRKKPSVDADDLSFAEARDFVFDWDGSPFKGLTVGETADLSKTQAEEYGYQFGAGEKYVEYLANKGDSDASPYAKRFLDG